MEEDIRKWSKRVNLKEKTQYNPIEVTEPLALVWMDLVGKLTVNYGLCEKFGIKRSLCSPYHPQTNGCMEKLNGTIQSLTFQSAMWLLELFATRDTGLSLGSMSREESEDTGYVRRDVKEAVWSYLPGLPDDLLTTMLDELGVESIEDLTLVEERDLVKYLKPIQSRTLMKGIKDGPVTLNMDLVSAPDPSAPSSPTPCSPNTTFQPPNQLLPSPPSTAPSTSSASQPGVPWHVDFRLNWDQVSSAIQLRVEKEERPLPDERKAFVVMLVDQMMQHDRNPTRAMCHSVVRNIVRSHPKSFGDIGKHGDTAGDGCHSLLQQVKTRVEYKNRNNTLAQCRRERRPRTEMAGEARLASGPVDQYGCVRWGPADSPEGETEATLENMKRDLLNIYSGMPSTLFLEEGMSWAERAEPMMEKTYVILRKYLNKVPAPAMSEFE
ncbi:uncharacterized protein LOC119891681 [Micropterus salmoides]|uniref:uncharacterized protein LOC119891681 n=1 Tax=Micropterus salmoides TaxID=27706 RepID=UPI0018ECDD76|nr:uncharacterized protein LOC119891681 [Micropterus salmoides]